MPREQSCHSARCTACASFDACSSSLWISKAASQGAIHGFTTASAVKKPPHFLFDLVFCSSAISHNAMPKTLIARSNFLNKWHHMAARLLEIFLIRHPEESGSPCFFDCVKASTAFWTSAQCRWTHPWSSYKSKSLGCRNCVPKLQGLCTCCIKHIKHIKQFRMDHNINIQLAMFGILGNFLFATGVWIWSFTLTLCPHHSSTSHIPNRCVFHRSAQWSARKRLDRVQKCLQIR